MYIYTIIHIYIYNREKQSDKWVVCKSAPGGIKPI